jgi:single-strand DNA-binding protein
MIAVVVVGNVGNFEVRYTGDGTPILSLSVASNGREKIHGEWKDVATWVKCSWFGKRAENFGSLVQKGSTVVVRGNLTLGSFQGRDGQTRTSLECRVDDIDFAGPKRQDGGGEHAPAPQGQGGQRPQGQRQAPATGGGGYQRRPEPAAAPPPAAGGGDDYTGDVDPDEDIPFASCSMSHDPILRSMRWVRFP